ncbi:activity-regulated cytoskeleton associated protein 1-like [Coccinella septempunctata]|uniref:activity-regulated cytoskeleton associated protein 1-like n=1 Tax=Coccinella septempunctata TaxID=41139 RepID=UPI001D07D004|nr:activity-regulated cytoskeleton associated protein 1-like [Coccinella septempunctata]
MANVVLTNEQFAELMSRISVAGNSTQGVAPAGNFSKCSSRFDGSKDSDVNAFIDAISIYKDCVQVSDANALKGLPMLFDDFAAKWYQGVKSTVNTWDEALALLRTTFGPQKPPYRVYRELFAQEQDSETPTDIFICKMRSILAQLPSGTLNETVQLDMVYGLLNRRIREKTPT